MIIIVQTTFVKPLMNQASHQIPQETELGEESFMMFLNQRNITKKDSILPLFENHILTTSKQVAEVPLPFIEKSKLSNSTFFVIFMVILGFWAFYYQKHYKGLVGIINSFFSNNVLFQELNDKSGANGIVSLGMFLLGIITLSVFSYQVLEIYPISFFLFDMHRSVVAMLFIGMGLIFSLLVKTTIIFCIGFIFNAIKIIQGYMTLLIISIQILGIVLLPITVLYTYGRYLPIEWIVKIGLFFIALIFTYRLLRSFLLAVKQTNSQVFHIILYICALEILPILVVGRMLSLHT
ncbi:MAG: DUF4271 domain-containing protein [Salibacteraceae bacterium]